MTDFNETRLDAADPRLTAFALGELEGEELARVAAAVAADPALQAAVEEIRDTASRLTAALDAEPLPLPAPPLRVGPYHTVRPARLFQWPYWGVAALAAAACLALVFTLRENPRARRAAAPAPAETGGEGAAGTSAAGRVQPSNHVDIVFPSKTTEVAEEASASSEDTEKWGQVVPNPTVAKAPASAPAPAATAPVRMARSRTVRHAPAPAAPAEAAGGRIDNDFVEASREARSSFDIEVPTASYAEVRRLLALGRRPPPEDVRIEELVNAFSYRYAAPAPTDPAPFAAALEVASAPWAPGHRLVRIGLKGREAPAVIARDVQVQVEFNPRLVQAYRLIGFENRPRRTGEPDGGIEGRDIAAGRAVTALYEVIPAGAAEDQSGAAVDQTGYRAPAAPAGAAARARPEGAAAGLGDKLLMVRIDYLAPGDAAQRRLEFPLVDRGAVFAEASADFKFAAAVAGFGLVLRDSPHQGAATLSAVAGWAAEGRGADAGGPRTEFITLVKRAEEILSAHG